MRGLPLFTILFLEFVHLTGLLTSDMTIVAAGGPLLSPSLHASQASRFQTRLLSPWEAPCCPQIRTSGLLGPDMIRLTAASLFILQGSVCPADLCSHTFCIGKRKCMSSVVRAMVGLSGVDTALGTVLSSSGLSPPVGGASLKCLCMSHPFHISAP